MDRNIAVRAFLKMRFGYHRLFAGVPACLMTASFIKQGAAYLSVGTNNRWKKNLLSAPLYKMLDGPFTV